MVFDFLEIFGISKNIIHLADNNKEKWGTNYKSLLVLSLDEVVKKVKENHDVYIIIGAIHLSDIKK